MKRFIPNYYAKNLFSLDIDFYINNHIEYILCDLDNTLDAFDSITPNEETIAYVNKIIEKGIKFYILSNNQKKRVSPFAKALGVEYLHHTGKPFGFKIKRFLKMKGLNINKGMMIGDQILTDVLAAKNVGIRVCLVDQLVKRDQWCTFFNRIIDNHLRNKMIKKGQITRIGG